MTLFRNLIIVTGLTVFYSSMGFCPSPAMAEESNNGAAILQSTDVAPELSDNVAAKVKKHNKTRKKTRKKTAKKTVKKNQHSRPVLEAGQKMTLNQVTHILKTTRDLSGRDLSGLNLVGVNLSKCNLKGADLRHANFERADLGESNLERADLADANLKMTNFRLSGMLGANLNNAILDGAIWTDGKICAPASFGQCRDSLGG